MIATYNYWLVFISVLVAILASYTTLDLVTRITASSGRAARAWLVGGAFSMGVGIWSMHFVGMLAFHLPIPMSYDVATTLLSMLIAIVVSGFALFMVSRDTFSARNLVVGGATTWFRARRRGRAARCAPRRGRRVPGWSSSAVRGRR